MTAETRDLKLQCPECAFSVSMGVTDDFLRGALTAHQGATGHLAGYDLDQLIAALRLPTEPQPAP